MATVETTFRPRIDAREKVTGAAQYTEDLPSLPGTLYARALLSPYSHARILSINAEKAEALPGVAAVLTREHLDGFNPRRARDQYGPGDNVPDQTIVATDKVRFDGDVVGMVVAEDLATADQAVMLIDVEYEELPAVFDPRNALAPDAPLIHEQYGTNHIGDYKFGWGDVDEGFKEANHIIENTFTFGNVFHRPMENVGIFQVDFRGGEIDIWAPIQHPYGAREEIGRMFGLEPEHVRIRMPYIGGGFGAKELKPAMLCATFLARKTGRPVRIMPSTEESFRTDSRHYVVYKNKTGLKADGTIVAQDIEVLVEAGGYGRQHVMGTTRNAVVSSWGPYRTPHLRVVGKATYSNKTPAGAFRGVGKVQTTWGCESHMDSVARQLGIDPVEFRLKNVLHRGDIFVAGTTPMDADFDDLIPRAYKAIDWDGRATRLGPPPAKPEEGPRLARGRGMAISIRHGYNGSGRTYAVATVGKSGIVKIRQNAMEIGEGAYSVISMVASEILEMPESQIQVSDPDLSTNPYFGGVGSQRTTVCMGNAVKAACEDLRRELIEVACKWKGGSPEEWRVAQGRLWHGEEDYSFGEAAGGLGGDITIMGKGAYSSPMADTPFRGIVPHWAVSVGAADVEVDRETGQVRLLKYVSVADVGKALNPVSARAQVDSGAIMGLGNTFYEESVYGDGQLLTGNDMEYRLPLLEDLPPEWHSLMVENGDGPGPFGSKGMAQTSIVVIAPAVGNAIYEATGVRIHDLPITPEKVLRSLGKL